jgi:hypothetical protein
MDTAANPIPARQKPYGVVTLDGRDYIERFQLFVVEIEIREQKQVLLNQRLTLPGVANFLLKGLCQHVDKPRFGVNEFDLYRFRLVNTEGSVWYFSGGMGIFDDRALSWNCFGTGQFPYPLVPPVPVQASGSLIYEVEDLGNRLFLYYPYFIRLGFVGAYLIPAGEAGNPTGPLAYPGAM